MRPAIPGSVATMLVTALLLFTAPAGPARAVQPDEVLDDPVLEERARALSRELRCLVCRNESIDDSSAELARDLRLLVRERLVEGDSDGDVVAFVVARYGEYVLLRPQATGSSMLLWGAGPAGLLLGLGVAGLYLRRRARAGESVTAVSLSADEQTRLQALLKE